MSKSLKSLSEHFNSVYVTKKGNDSVYKPGGSKTFAELPIPTKPVLGMIYNVTDKFTTTDIFLEGAGWKHGAGANVAVVEVPAQDENDEPTYKYDVMGEFFDTGEFFVDAKLSDDGTKIILTRDNKTTVEIPVEGNGIAVSDVNNASITAKHGRVMLTWTDPEDTAIDNIKLAKWTGTLVVRKEGSAPESKTDGTVVIDSASRNAYSSTPFTDSGLEDGVTYYYRFFPHAGNTYTDGTILSATPDREVISIPTAQGGLIYNGNYQTETFDNYDSAKMTYTGDIGGTNADDYTATFTPADDYKWSDGTTEGKEVSWTIAKAACMFSLNAESIGLSESKLTDTVTVTRPGDGAISAESSDETIATVSVSGTTITVTFVADGSANVTVSVAEGTNHLAAEDDLTFSVKCKAKKALNACTPAEIKEIVNDGDAAAFWKVGDVTSNITLNGNVSDRLTLSDYQCRAVILGFDHNASVETGGKKSVHFALGKDSSNKDIAFCEPSAGTSVFFCHNSNGGNKNVRIDTSVVCNDVMSKFKAAMPSEWQNIIGSTTKYGYHSRGGVATNYILPTTFNLFIPAFYEIMGVVSNLKYESTTYLKQYTYYVNGNSKVRYKHNDTSVAYEYWTRSSASDYRGVLISTGGTQQDFRADSTSGVIPCFAVVADK